MENSYSADSIKVLEGLEAVRKRPHMYIRGVGTEGLHHLVYEVVDNSVDEALGGHATIIEMVIHQNGSLSVRDDGRGIPVGPHPTENMDTIDVVMTKLHAGGKFDGSSYKVSGGLHGVGVSCVNALSEWLEVEVWREGKRYKRRYEKGIPVGVISVDDDATHPRGTRVCFKADATVLEATEFNFDVLANRMRELSFLNPGLRIRMTDERTEKQHDFKYEGGMSPTSSCSTRTRLLISTRRSRWSASRTARRCGSRSSGTTASTRRSSPSPTTSTPRRRRAPGRASERAHPHW